MLCWFDEDLSRVANIESLESEYSSFLDQYPVERVSKDEVRAKGLNPAILVDKLRPHTQRVYQHFTLAEKKRPASPST